MSAKKMVSRGQVHVYTGDGKGKTTAAAGLAARMAGYGYVWQKSIYRAIH